MLTIDNTLDGYLKDVEIKGNTIQDINGTGDLSDIRSVGTKVEGQELYEIPVLITNGLDSSDSNYQEDKLAILSPTPLEKIEDVCSFLIRKVRKQAHLIYFYLLGRLNSTLHCYSFLMVSRFTTSPSLLYFGITV